MSSDQNWIRTYTFQAGADGTGVFMVGNVDSVVEPALHIYFNIEKSDSETANTAKVQIWNLCDDNLAILEQSDCIVVLKAGYQNQNSLILSGTVSTVESELDNADCMTEIEVIDGMAETKSTAVSISLNGEVDTESLYNQIASEAGMPIVFADDLEYTVLPNGFTFAGTTAEAIAKVAESNGHSYTIQNGVIQITNPGSPISTYGYLLSAETGLISIPSKITIAAVDDTEEDQSGYEVVYFLNGNIGVNDVVYIDTKKVSGYFRVHKLTIEGDNYDGDWICTAQVIQVAEADSEGLTYA